MLPLAAAIPYTIGSREPSREPGLYAVDLRAAVKAA